MYAQGGVDGRVWFRVWGWRGPPSTGLNVAAAEWGPGLTLLLQPWTPGGGEGQVGGTPQLERGSSVRPVWPLMTRP